MQPGHALHLYLMYRLLLYRRHTGTTVWRALKIAVCGALWLGSSRRSTLGRNNDGRSGKGETVGGLRAARFARTGKCRQSNRWAMVGRMPVRLTITCVWS